MSHFAVVKVSNVTNADAFIAAAKELGFTGKVSQPGTLRGWNNRTQKADLVIEGSNGYDIGLVKNKQGTFDLVADWMGIPGTVKGKPVQQALVQGAIKHTIINKYQREGFRATVTEQEDGNLQVALVRS